MHLYKRGDTWWVQLGDGSGGRVRRSLKTTNKREAEKRAAIELGRLGPYKGEDKTPLGAALRTMIEVTYAGRSAGTIRCYTQKARWLVEILGSETPLCKLTKHDVAGYRVLRLKDGASTSTVYKELVVLRRCLAEHDITGVVPVTKVNYQPRTNHLTRDEFAGLMDMLPADRQLWLAVAVYTGARLSELESLRWEDVDGTKWIRLRGTKTGGSFRRIPFSKSLKKWLRRPAKEDYDPMASVVQPWSNCRRDLSVAFSKITRRKDAKLTPNDLRRTFASWLKQAGVDSLTVAHLLGHNTTRMVDMVYGRLNDKTYQDAVGVL